MLRTLLAAAALVTAAGIAPAAMGQGAPPGAEPAIAVVPQYQVEVIIFAYRDFDPNEERFASRPPRILSPQVLREPPVFDDSSFDPLLPDPTAPLPGAGPAPDASAAEPEDGFRLLRSDELQLNAEYRKIGNVPTYLPLVHAGWVQPGLPEEQAEPVDLARLGALNPMGSIRVYLTRYLHVTVDLSYQDTLHQRGGTQPTAPAGGLDELEIAPRYNLVDERTVTRSSELHYFDHPAFGVLVKITPAPASTPTTPAATGPRPAA